MHDKYATTFTSHKFDFLGELVTVSRKLWVQLVLRDEKARHEKLHAKRIFNDSRPVYLLVNLACNAPAGEEMCQMTQKTPILDPETRKPLDLECGQIKWAYCAMYLPIKALMKDPSIYKMQVDTWEWVPCE